MNIAFDLRRIGNPGIGRYMKCLVEAVLSMRTENRYFLIVPRATKESIDTGVAGPEIVTSAAKYYSFREQAEIPAILRRYRIDLLHSPHFLMPIIRPCPVVVTIHDVIYLARKEDLPSRLGRLYYRAMMTAAVRLAERIIADSEFSKQDIVRYLGADPAKIEVIYPGVSTRFQPVLDPNRVEAIRRKHGIERDYVLYAGIDKPRKNHAGLLRAFHRFLSSGGDAELVIAGPLKEGAASLRRLANELGMSGRLKPTGFVDDDELRVLYAGARLYACPSLYEGFGFTVLEAMACGTPVVCSSETSLPEVAGDAAIYADARDPKAFGEALFRVFSNAALRATLVAKGLDNVRRFSWERAAEQTLAVYRDARYPTPQIATA
jgi:glycosyltransferase involved in cell wall biosynthesis